MALIQCPECGKEISDKAPACPNCGNPMPTLAAPTSSQAINLENLLGLARTADLAGNSGEAEKYYTQILELDPTVSEAWVGKGKSAAWQSSIVNMRFGEMLIAFNHAIATAPGNEKTDTITICVTEANQIIVTLYGMAHRHMLEFISLPETWASYLVQVRQMIEALETIGKWDNRNKTTFENIVFLCKDNIEGVSYEDEYDNNTPKVWHLSPEYEALIRQKMNEAVQQIQKIDPQYTAPTVEVKKPKPVGCVVAVFLPVIILAAMALSSSLLAQDWSNDANIKVSKALVKNNIRGCGQMRWRPNPAHRSEVIVQCAPDGQYTHEYLVFTAAEKVEGPYKPGSKYD